MIFLVTEDTKLLLKGLLNEFYYSWLFENRRRFFTLVGAYERSRPPSTKIRQSKNDKTVATQRASTRFVKQKPIPLKASN